MEKWAIAIAGAVVLACLLTQGEPAPSRGAHGLAFHVRTAHCHIAGTLSPTRVRLFCA
jgi:hypothetical protein